MHTLIMAKMTNSYLMKQTTENIMKHSYNNDSGINMSSNENDAME